MISEPKISVIMSTYNEDILWVKESVNSILNQTYKNIEFIIVVDNSNRKDIINYLEECKNNDDRIVLEINKNNLGLIKSLNKAINISKGEYLARMDADDISMSNRLETQLKYINNNNLDLIGANAILFNENGIIEKTNKLICHKYLEKYLKHSSIGIIHPTFFGRKELFRNCMYNELALYAEDVEFVAHSLVLGYKMGNCPDFLIKVRYRDNSIMTTKSYKSYLTANNIKFCYKQFKKSKKYVYNTKKIEKKWNNEAENNKFITQKVLLREAKQFYNQKKYFKFLIKLLKSIFKSRQSIISIIDVFYLKSLKYKENKFIYKK